MKNKKKYVLVGIVLFIMFSISGALLYMCMKYTFSFDQLIFTLKNSTKGTSSDMLLSGIGNTALVIIIGLLLYFLLIFIICPHKYSYLIYIRLFKKTVRINLSKYFFHLVYFLAFLFLFLTMSLANRRFGIISYIKNYSKISNIYENHYINAEYVNILADGDENNLIIIYLESIETTFLSKDDGGKMDYELMPNLNNLAKENINFSFDNNTGFLSPKTANFSLAAKFASMSGTGYNFNNGNESDPDKPFAEKLIMLGDILNKNDYYQEMITVGDSRFAGENSLFLTHGFDKVFDYYSALEEGYTNDFVWWGIDDKTLYEVAKDELTNIYKNNDHFCLVMATCDTHASGGYVCDLCDDKYDSQYMNVINCVDNQIYSFVKWLEQQDFYNDTTIVILGDHPTMDTELVEGLSESERYVYNCFINSVVEAKNIKNRKFDTFDMFPTILASIGFEIEGNKLGFGTDLFSNKNTMEEALGYEFINKEISKRSVYFAEHFY